VALGLLVLIPAAQAQETSPEDRERALDLFQESAQHYEEGRFGVAAELLREAYALHPEPVLLYNLGRALDGLGDAESAVEAYHNYLAAAPEAEDRPVVEERISILSAQIETERRRRDGPTEPAGYQGAGALPYALAIVGGAALAAGGILWLEAEDRHEAAAQDPVHESAARRAAAAEDFAVAGNVSFVTGLLMLAGGAAWIAVDLFVVEPAEARVSVGPLGVTLRGRF